MNSKIGNVQLMQKLNRLKVLECIRKNPNIVRPIVSEKTGLSLASITNIVSYLIESGLVKETGYEDADRIGRKAILLNFCPDSYNFVCVSVLEDKVRVAITDLEGKTVKETYAEVEKGDPNKTILNTNAEIKKLLEDFDESKILAIGVAVSALVLPNQTVAVSSNLKWDNFDIKSILEKEFSYPVMVVNTTVARGHFSNEHYNSEEIDGMLFVDLMDGVGAVHFVDGHQNKNMIGEIGHTTVDKDGDECFCGNRGCLEVMCSVERAGKKYIELGKGKNAHSIIDGYNRGEKTAIELLRESGEYLGIGIANIINVMNPDCVIMNVGQYSECRGVLDVAVNEAKRRVFSAICDNVKFKIINISDDMMTEGVAQCLCEQIFSLDFELNII